MRTRSATSKRAFAIAVGILLIGLLLPLSISVSRSEDASAARSEERVTITRDRFGVPHVTAKSTKAVSFGAGYALAQDRLWQMHTFRLIGKGRLSELLGPLVVDIDKEIRLLTYTAEERAARFATYPPVVKRAMRAFRDGINAWIDQANSDPSKLPLEFVEFGVGPAPRWTVDDSIGLQDVLVLAFGSGGGGELEQAALLDALKNRLGKKAGRDAFDDLVQTEYPDSPLTIPRGFDWKRTPTAAREGQVERTRRLNRDARLSLPESKRASAKASPAIGTVEQAELVPDPKAALADFHQLQQGLERLKAAFTFGSNAQIVGPGRSEEGNSLQTAGPQVGYLVPQWLADIGLHGGGVHTTGMTFAGVGPAVLIGRGPGYAWTTTTGAADLTDTYVVRLDPRNPHEYRYRGRFEPMDCRTETYSFRDIPFEEEEICRTRHGPVISVDEEHDRAYALRSAWFNREVQTVKGFFGFNTVRNLADFATAAGKLASNHNMLYVDDQGHYGYWHPANHPVRPPGTDLRLPQDGSGGAEWRGIRSNEEAPHAVDFPRGWLVNWNNQPAAGWERERGWEARDNVNDLQPVYRGRDALDPRGGPVNRDRRWSFDELNANLRHAALKSHLHSWFRSALPRGRDLDRPVARQALGVVRRWDGFLVDGDGDGTYDSAGPTILGQWIDALRSRVFADELSEEEMGFADVETALWQAVSPRSSYRTRYDWLNGEPRAEVIARAFEEAVAGLAEERGGSPASWKNEIAREHYQRLNTDLFTDTAATTVCGELEALLGECPVDPGADSGIPGDIPDQIEMDRGTYNHVVSYLDPPVGSGPLGESAVRAGSVIPPGQSGFVGLTGRESRHFEDQQSLYLDWRYKPMPLTASEIAAEHEATETLIYPPR